MQWLDKIVDEIIAQYPDGDILVESGSAPSGKYHLGHLRELVTCDAVLLGLARRGRKARHIHFSDDLDALRKIPVNVPEDFDKYLGKPLCSVPAPEGSATYAEYFLKDFIDSADKLGIEIDFMRAHQNYERGFFTPAIEKTLTSIDSVRQILEQISGRKLENNWSPVQIMEEGYLKTRSFVSINTEAKTIKYLDNQGQENEVSYTTGQVKLNWRIDWPARWWLLAVQVEPFGRDHATKGGSYDTGAAIIKDVFGAPPPLPVPYDFVNLAGDTKKMSASKGTGVTASDVIEVLPPEVVRFFMLRYPPSKRLYFDPANISRLIDEFAGLLDKEPESELVKVSLSGLTPTISPVPFSHLAASYQAALRDTPGTLDLLRRTGYDEIVAQNEAVIKKELSYIDQWLDKWAPEDSKFTLADYVDAKLFSEDEKNYLSRLAGEIEKAPPDADGEWFHKAIYQFKKTDNLQPPQLFGPLYRALIGKEQGPRAGWFLSILPRDWLIKRLRLEA